MRYRVDANKTKIESIENELQKLKNFSEKLTFGIYSIFVITSQFDGSDGFQAYLVFQTVHKYFGLITNTKHIPQWKSTGLSDKSIKPITTSDNSLAQLIRYYVYKLRLKLNGSNLRQPKVVYTHKKAVNIYIVYELAGYSSHSDEPTPKKCLFGAVTLTKNADIDKYRYSYYGIGFDRKSSLAFPGGGFRQNVLIFGADISSSAHIDNKKRHISSRKRINTGIRTYINCRKNVFN